MTNPIQTVMFAAELEETEAKARTAITDGTGTVYHSSQLHSLAKSIALNHAKMHMEAIPDYKTLSWSITTHPTGVDLNALWINKDGDTRSTSTKL